VVQGVGFRPFIYKLANELNLTGYVLNNSNGVFVEAEGKESEIRNFLLTILLVPYWTFLRVSDW